MPIGTLNEGSIHAALKAHYAEPGDLLEASVGGYVVDILRDDRIVEIQTAGFSGIAHKLRALVADHRVRLVHPVPAVRWLVKLRPGARGASTRRRSPRRGGFEQVFEELVSLPDLLAHPNFELEVATIEIEEVRRPLRRARRGRAYRVVERRLLAVHERRVLRDGADLLSLLPPDLAEPFGTAELAAALGTARGLAQRAAYFLREAGAVQQVGKSGNALLYARG